MRREALVLLLSGVVSLLWLLIVPGRSGAG
jgi:hypothetical protein